MVNNYVLSLKKVYQYKILECLFNASYIYIIMRKFPKKIIYIDIQELGLIQIKAIICYFKNNGFVFECVNIGLATELLGSNSQIVVDGVEMIIYLDSVVNEDAIYWKMVKAPDVISIDEYEDMLDWISKYDIAKCGLHYFLDWLVYYWDYYSFIRKRELRSGSLIVELTISGSISNRRVIDALNSNATFSLYLLKDDFKEKYIYRFPSDMA